MSELQLNTGCSTVCGTCGDLANEILNDELSSTASHPFLPVLSISTS